MRLTIAAFLFGSIVAVSASGQSVISVHSGVIHYTEGDVYAQDKLVELKFGHFPELKPNETLRTEAGRAELLLTPGSFLRVAENSEIRMISNQLSDTKFELIKGEILVESVGGEKDSAAAQTKGNAITVTCKDSTTMLVKPGLYGFTSDPSRLRVFEGEAIVKADSGQLTLKKGHETLLTGALMAQKFDAKNGDDLTRWSARRSGYLATANVASARMASTSGSGSGLWSSYMGGYGLGGYGYGGWMFNPSFGMYTYMPYGGMAFSPFGYGYFSPYTVYQVLPYYYGGGAGATGGGYVGNRNAGGSVNHAANVGRAAAWAHSGGVAGGSSGFSTASSGGGFSGSGGRGFSGSSMSSGGMRGASVSSSGHAAGGGRGK